MGYLILSVLGERFGGREPPSFFFLEDLCVIRIVSRFIRALVPVPSVMTYRRLIGRILPLRRAGAVGGCELPRLWLAFVPWRLGS